MLARACILILRPVVVPPPGTCKAIMDVRADLAKHFLARIKWNELVSSGQAAARQRHCNAKYGGKQSCWATAHIIITANIRRQA